MQEKSSKKYVNDYPPKLKILLKISELKNVSIDWLLTGEEPKPATNLIEEKASQSAEEEEEFAAMFYNYRDLTEEDKDELRGLMAYVDHEIARRKKRREENPRTADLARMEQARSHKR